ncbi:MAG: hypothetical protein ACRET5_20375, partial [Steroidobacteraceae bacterium]
MSASVTDKALLALINLIYEAACDPGEGWPEFLRAFACAVKGPGALIFGPNLETMNRSTTEASFPDVGLYQALLPHLARAAQIQHRFASLQSLSNSSLAVLDTVPAAVMLLDASGRTLHRNASADAELRRGDPFKLGPSGELFLRGPLRGQLAVRTAIGAA